MYELEQDVKLKQRRTHLVEEQQRRSTVGCGDIACLTNRTKCSDDTVRKMVNRKTYYMDGPTK